MFRVIRIEVSPTVAESSTIKPPSSAFPSGYKIGVTRYADVILENGFPQRFRELTQNLEQFTIDVSEVETGGGSRASHTRRFDEGLARFGWGKKNIVIEKYIDGRRVQEVRGHEIDMFADGSIESPYPGVAVEMEWNNKDPFFDRDLVNFQALHSEGAIGVGVIVTRGPNLQELLGRTIKTNAASGPKYGQSSTHWNKLVPRVALGGGGQCPLILIGIETPRLIGHERLLKN
jgi:hypothetical protein